MKIENWNGHEIRFVEVNGEWWAVAMDVAKALGYKHTPHMLRNLNEFDKDVHNVDTLGGKQEMAIINEYGIYDAIFNRRKKELEPFKRWVFGVIKELRKASGLEGFQVFRQLDKEHQKEQMRILNNALSNPVRIDFIKANTITNKVVSNKYGFEKMVKKGEMTSEMLVAREPILEATVEVMGIKEKYDLPISVSETINKKFN